MTSDPIRENHFSRLNSYRQSKEYQDWYQSISGVVPETDFPSLIGKRWEVTGEIYDEFLDMLPPVAFDGSRFYMSEESFDGYRAKFSREGDRYYCEFARYPELRLPGPQP